MSAWPRVQPGDHALDSGLVNGVLEGLERIEQKLDDLIGLSKPPIIVRLPERTSPEEAERIRQWLSDHPEVFDKPMVVIGDVQIEKIVPPFLLKRKGKGDIEVERDSSVE